MPRQADACPGRQRWRAGPAASGETLRVPLNCRHGSARLRKAGNATVSDSGYEISPHAASALLLHMLLRRSACTFAIGNLVGGGGRGA